MRAPDEGVILLRLELMIDEAIHEGRIDPSRFLMPAKIFKNASGNLIIFSPMRLAELTESDLSELTPLDGKIGSNEIHKTVQRGNWPLSSIEVTTFNGGRTTMLMHDLAHFEGFLRYPEYALAFRNVFERVSHELALNQTGLSRSIGYLTEEFTEFASLLMPDASPVLESILEGLPRLEDVGIDGSVQSLIDARARVLEQRSPEEIHRLRARLAAAHVEDWERPVGGNQLDPINNEWHATRLRSRLGSWPITTFLDPTSEPLSRITSTQDLAKFLTAMEALEHLEPEDYLGLLASGSRAFDLSARHPREKWLTQYFLAAYHHDAGEIRVSILLATPRAVREVIDGFLSGRQSNMSRLQIRIANESVLLGGGPMLTYLTRRKMELESSPNPRRSEVEKALQFIDRAIVSCSNKLDSRDPRLVRLQPVLNGPADTATRLAALEREFPIPTAPQ